MAAHAVGPAALADRLSCLPQVAARSCLAAVNDSFQVCLREAEGRHAEPGAAILDSQSVKSDGHGGEAGYDAGKGIKGRRRHILVDVLGLLLGVGVTPASCTERDGGRKVLERIAGGFARLRRVWVDGGYSGEDLADWVKRQHPQVEVEVVERPGDVKGFQVPSAAETSGGGAHVRLVDASPPPRPGLRAQGVEHRSLDSARADSSSTASACMNCTPLGIIRQALRRRAAGERPRRAKTSAAATCRGVAACCRIALDFLRAEKAPLTEMQNADALQETRRAKRAVPPRQTGRAPLRPPPANGGGIELDLTRAAGGFSVKRFNPRAGGAPTDNSVAALTGGGRATLAAPSTDNRLAMIVMAAATSR